MTNVGGMTVCSRLWTTPTPELSPTGTGFLMEWVSSTAAPHAVGLQKARVRVRLLNLMGKTNSLENRRLSTPFLGPKLISKPKKVHETDAACSYGAYIRVS